MTYVKKNGRLEAVIFIFVKNKKILLVEKRDIKRVRDPGIFAFPGGMIEKGDLGKDEDYKVVALRREVKEELSLDNFSYRFITYHNYETGKKKYGIYYYVCNEWKGTIPHKNAEGDSLLWVNIKDALDVIEREPDKKVIKNFFLN